MTIILCGTSHISTDSQKRIDQLIEQYSPDIIAVELDRDRVRSLFEKEQPLPLSVMFKVGVGPYCFMKMGRFAQKYLAKKVNTSPGVDMKYAIVTAGRHKLKLALIDRHIQVTLSRLFKKITCVNEYVFLQNVHWPFSKEAQQLKRHEFERNTLG